MKKYFTDCAFEVQQDRATVVVYLASDVDARIAELEKALQWVLQNHVIWTQFIDGGCFIEEAMACNYIKREDAPPEAIALVRSLMVS